MASIGRVANGWESSDSDTSAPSTPRRNNVEVEKRASELVQKVLHENKEVSAETKSFVKGKIEPVVAYCQQQMIDLNPAQQIAKVSVLIERLAEQLKTIDFYPYYEMERPRVFGVNEFTAMVKNLNKLADIYNVLKSTELKEDFLGRVKPFFEGLKSKLCENVSRSRNAELESLLAVYDENNPDHQFRAAVVREEIARLQEPEKYHEHLQILKDLLNLTNNKSRHREPTQKEHRAFRFICDMTNLLFPLQR